MKEKRILTKEEWQEMQEMQERAKAKRKAEEEKNKKYKKIFRLKKNIKEEIKSIFFDLVALISMGGIIYIIILLDTLLHY